MDVLGTRLSAPDDVELGQRGQEHQPAQVAQTETNDKLYGLNIDTDESAEGWLQASKRLRENDIRKYRGMGEDVDTVILVATLFSIIVAVFGIDRYKSLTSTPSSETVDLLKTISQQLSGVNISSTTNPISSFHRSASDITTNVLWFSSLVFSLVAASLGMLLKQWFREYLTENSTTPMEYCRVRFFRNQGIAVWKMEEVAASLPFLMHFAILLFLAGLAVFTLSLDHILGIVITTLIGIWALMFFFANISPIFSTISPYKSPFLRGTLQHLQGSTRSVFSRLNTAAQIIAGNHRSSFKRTAAASEEDLRKDSTQDLDILAGIHKDFVDNKMLGITAECIMSSKSPYTVENVMHCWSRVASLRGFSGYFDLASISYGRPIRATFRYLVISALDKQLKWEKWMSDITSSRWFIQYNTEEPQWNGYITFAEKTLQNTPDEDVITTLAPCEDKTTYRFSTQWIRPRVWKVVQAALDKELSWAPWMKALFAEELKLASKYDGATCMAKLLEDLSKYGNTCMEPALAALLRCESKFVEQLVIRTAFLDILQSYAKPGSEHCHWQPWMKDLISGEILMVPLDANDAFESHPHLDATIKKMWISGDPEMSGNATWACFAEEGLRGITYFPVAYVSYDSDIVRSFVDGLIHTLPQKTRSLSTHLRIFFFTLKLLGSTTTEIREELTQPIQTMADLFVDLCPAVPQHTRRPDSVLHEYMRRSLKELNEMNDNTDGLLSERVRRLLERAMAYWKGDDDIAVEQQAANDSESEISVV